MINHRRSGVAVVAVFNGHQTVVVQGALGTRADLGANDDRRYTP